MRQGYVSVAAAAEFYGVVIDPETFAVDHVATERMRSRLRQADETHASQQVHSA